LRNVKAQNSKQKPGRHLAVFLSVPFHSIFLLKRVDRRNRFIYYCALEVIMRATTGAPDVLISKIIHGLNILGIDELKRLQCVR
jgi:hypothetical protein